MNIIYFIEIIFILVTAINAEDDEEDEWGDFYGSEDEHNFLVLNSPREIELTGLNFPQNWETRKCDRSFISGFKAKYQLNFSESYDEHVHITQLELSCGYGLENLTFSGSENGGWSKLEQCENGQPVGFQLKAKLRDHFNYNKSDDEWSGITGIAIYCFDKTNYKFTHAKFEASYRPERNPSQWTHPQFCFPNTYLCGVNTLFDPVSLIDIKFQCCESIEAEEDKESKFSHQKIKGSILRTPSFKLDHYFQDSKIGSHRFSNQMENFFLLGDFNRPYWQFWNFCQDDSYVTGLQLHLSDLTFSKTIIDGIKFTCDNPIEYLQETTYISDQAKFDDNYGYELKCSGAKVVVGFQILYDHLTEIQNLRLFCSHNPDDYIEGSLEIPRGKLKVNESTGMNVDYFEEADEKKEDTMRWEVKYTQNKLDERNSSYEGREWLREIQMCKLGEAICGFKVNSGASWEEGIGPFDLQMKCCHVPRLSESCLPEDSWELVLERDNTEGIGPITQLYRQVTGVSQMTDKSKRDTISENFYESLNAEVNNMESLSTGSSNREAKETSHVTGKGSGSGGGTNENSGKSLVIGTGITNFNSSDDQSSEMESRGSGSMSRGGITMGINQDSSVNTGKGKSSSSGQSFDSSLSTTRGESKGTDFSLSGGGGFNFGPVSLSASVDLKKSFEKSFSNTQGSSNTNNENLSAHENEEAQRGKSDGENKQNSTTTQTNAQKMKNQERIFSKSEAKSWAKKYGKNSEGGKGRNEDFRIDETTGIFISDSIDESENERREEGRRTGESNGKGFSTSYNWGESSTETWNTETTREVSYEIPAGVRSRLYQAVGKCSYYTVRTTLFKRVDTFKDNLLNELVKEFKEVKKKFMDEKCSDVLYN